MGTCVIEQARSRCGSNSTREKIAIKTKDLQTNLDQPKRGRRPRIRRKTTAELLGVSTSELTLDLFNGFEWIRRDSDLPKPDLDSDHVSTPKLQKRDTVLGCLKRHLTPRPSQISETATGEKIVWL